MSKRTPRCPSIQPDVLVIGIDVAKKEFVAVSQSGRGVQGKARKFMMARDGFVAFHAWWMQAALSAGATGAVFALEPTGHYGTTLATWLQKEGQTVFLVQPLHTSRAKELYDGTCRKTDSKDAAVIADLCRRGVCVPWRTPEGAFAELRVLARRREQLVVARGQAINRLHRAMDVVFPELEDLFSRLISPTVLALLAVAPSPTEILAMDFDELVALIRRASRNQLGRERAEKLVEAAQGSIGVEEGAVGHRLAIQQVVDELQQLLGRIHQVEGVMLQQLCAVPYTQWLLSIPGLGRLTVATLLGEFGDLRDYRHSAQLIKMAGLDLVESSSGQHKGKRHISRRGRRYARQMLYLAALRLGGGVLAVPRDRMVELRKKEPTKAAVANMCRLLRILHALVRDKVTFDPSRFALAEVALAA